MHLKELVVVVRMMKEVIFVEAVHFVEMKGAEPVVREGTEH